MALNLDDLMPQALQDTLSSLVPTDTSEESLISNYFSMYEVGGGDVSMSLGDALMKSDFSSLYGDDSIGFQGTDQGGYATNDSWMTRSTIIPLTPEEAIGDVPYSTPLITSQSSPTLPHNETLGDIPYSTPLITSQSSPTLPHNETLGDIPYSTSLITSQSPHTLPHNEILGDVPYSTSLITSPFEGTPTYAQHTSSPSTPFAQHTPSPTYPLTPDSILSPSSAGHSSEELDEVLSYFNDDVSEGESAYATPTMLMHEDAYDPYSTFAHDYSVQSSSPSPLHPPPSVPTFDPHHTPVTPTTINTTTSIKDLLMETPTNNSSSRFSLDSSSTSSSTSSYDPLCMGTLTKSTIKPSSLGINLRKRKTDDSSDDCAVLDVSPVAKRLATKSNKKCARSSAKKQVNPVSRKERKREQNKTAALRYRQKKKGELCGVELKEFSLEEKNAELKETVESLEAEMKYLRDLWMEVSHAKNVREHLQRTLVSTQ